MRSTSKFRLKAAFGAALRQAGYDRVGRRLPGTDAGGAGAAAGRPGRANGSASAQVAELYGTVRILARDPKEMLKLPFAELVQHVGKIVKRLEIELGRDRNGEPVAWPWTADGKEAGTRAGKASPKHRGQKASKGTQQRKVEAAS